MSTQDRVRLSARERQRLAGLEAMLEAADPELARVLRGRRPGRALSGRPGQYREPPRAGFVQQLSGPVTVLVGLALVCATISTLLWLSMLGLLVVGAGLGLCAWSWRKAHPAKSRPVRRTVPD
jgi:protein-S-isoprenylcysteine O-methyltransferase Ste14